MWSILYLQALDEQGESIWPEYFPTERLEAFKRQYGGPIFKCMFMGDPSALSGSIFQAPWFQPFARLKIAPRRLADGTELAQEMTSYIVVDGDEEHPVCLDDCLIYQGWDLAISEKQTADYTACVTLALHPATMRLYILDVFRDHLSFQKTQEMMAVLAKRWGPHAIGIESQAYQAAAVQEARAHLLFPIREVRADRDKVTRSRLPAALAEGSKMTIVRGLWVDDFLDEAVNFPTGQHDDMVDALSIATFLAQKHVPSSLFLFG